jgi:hypothetical protein
LVKGSLHEDFDVHFIVGRVFNNFTPGISTWSIFNGGIVFLGPLVSLMSPFSVVGNHPSMNLHAIFTVDNMSSALVLTTPHGSNVGVEAFNGLLVITRVIISITNWRKRAMFQPSIIPALRRAFIDSIRVYFGA